MPEAPPSLDLVVPDTGHASQLGITASTRLSGALHELGPRHPGLCTPQQPELLGSWAHGLPVREPGGLASITAQHTTLSEY